MSARGAAPRRVLFVLAAVCASACASTPPAREPAPPSGPVIDVDVDAAREGRTLRVDVRGRARGRNIPDEFTAPRRWEIAARADGAALRQLVIGPSRTEETTTELDEPDLTLTFTTYFEPPHAAGRVDILVTAPGAAAEQRFEVEVD